MADITVGDALLMIGGDTKGAQQSINNLKEHSEKSLGEMAQQAGKVMTVMGAAITGTITGAIVHWMRAGDELDKMSARVDWSVESLSAFRHVVSEVGTDMGTFERALRYSQQQVDAFVQSGGSADHALAQLGLTAQDFAGLNMEEQFFKLVGALEQMDDQSRRNVVSAEIFGRRYGPELASMLNLGEAGLRAMRDEGFELMGMTTESAKAAAAFQDALNKLKNAFDPLLVVIAEAVQGELKDLIDSATEWVQRAVAWVKENEALTASIIKLVGAAGVIMTVLGPILIMLPGLVIAIKGIAAAFVFVAGAIGAPVALIAAAIAGVILIGWLLYDNWEQIKEGIGAIWNWLKDTASDLWEGIKNVFKAGGNFIVDVWTSTWDAIVGAFSWVWDSIKSIAGWIWETITGVLGGIWELGAAIGGMFGLGGGGQSLEPIPAFASGGTMANTGPAILGEHGAELVLSPTLARLQGGAQVINAEDTARMLGGGSGMTLNINVDGMVVREEADIQRISRELYDLSRRELEAKGNAY